MNGPRCVLVGAPGAGKSTVGQLLAAALGVSLRDTDQDVSALVGKPIPDIFVDEGEPFFREREHEAVLAALQSDAVVALGGGAVLDPRTRAALSGHPVIYLSVELTDALRRVGMGAGRPLLAINPRATLKYLLDQRRPLYLEVAAHTVVTDGKTAEAVTQEVRELLAF